MGKITLTPRTLVAEALEKVPAAARFFLDLRMDCLGCRMATFCTLEEACRQYELELERFLEDLHELEVPHASH